MQSHVEAHQGALNLMQRYVQDGDVAQIKRFVADAASRVRRHVSLAKNIGATFKQAAVRPGGPLGGTFAKTQSQPASVPASRRQAR